MADEVKIVVIGDSNVGKSSLIARYASNVFSDKVLSVVPQSLCLCEDHQICLVDTSAENNQQLEHELHSAKVICIVYPYGNPESFPRLSSYWLPKLRSLNIHVPIVLVMNKLDLCPDPSEMDIDFIKKVSPIMTEFKDVKTHIACSAKDDTNVKEAFHFATKAVLYPIDPLLDPVTRGLQEGFKVALKRIFRLCDKNGDGSLSHEELSNFHIKCFGSPISSLEYNHFRTTIEQNLDASAVVENGISFAGFAYFHLLFILKGHHENCWRVLRHYGYSNNLRLRPDFLVPHAAEQYKKKDVYPELTKEGLDFFREMFDKADRDKDGQVTGEELGELFATATVNEQAWSSHDFLPFSFAPDSPLPRLSRDAFLNQWRLTTAVDFIKTIKFFRLLGYEEDPVEAIRFVKKTDGLGARSVLHCILLGSESSGKSSIVTGLLGLPFSPVHSPTKVTRSAINLIPQTRKFLIMTEFGWEEGVPTEVVGEGGGGGTGSLRSEERRQLEFLSKTKERLSRADAFCITVDPTRPSSLSYALSLRSQLSSLARSVPVLLVETKKDHPDKQVLDNKLVKTNISVATPELTPSSPLFTKILYTALHPPRTKLYATIVIGMTFAAGLGVCFWNRDFLTSPQNFVSFSKLFFDILNQAKSFLKLTLNATTERVSELMDNNKVANN